MNTLSNYTSPATSILFSVAYSLFYKLCRQFMVFKDRHEVGGDRTFACYQYHFDTRIHFAAKCSRLHPFQHSLANKKKELSKDYKKEKMLFIRLH